jgi:hypothetical protein
MTDHDHEFTVGDPQSVVLGPTHDEDSDEWVLSFDTVTGDEVRVRLHPRALDELAAEADVAPEHRDGDRLPLGDRLRVYGDRDDHPDGGASDG